ncbi:alanine racemase [Flavonifractor sp. DFI.6.63]|mgnify:FL=1|uniref:alanine racemase n=1 Tax=Oscillospiraceae TaxID=216572 RepID=UPI00210B065E|nr:alanine racemase [Flavonifractor sp. DFI.6.63]MBS1385021.1 alanine racemase [Flavonifractor sp.]MCQ5030931.1 alanine racemase [Flavonifractor sp. DFI.6.63]MDU2194517.1 alanine racemase [Clostridiales bacterium]
MDDMQMRTWAEVDLSDLEHNYRALRGLLPRDCRFLGVVKANAYGHGAVPVAKRLEALGAEYLAVACLEEAGELRGAGIQTPILILGATPAADAPRLLELEVTQAVGDLETAQALSRAAQAAGKRLKVHLKADTGMSRLGFLCDETHLSRAAEEMARAAVLPGLEAEGIFTHFADADGDEAYTMRQFTRFLDLLGVLERRGVRFALRHCANSAAVLRYPCTHLDMVRPGVALYGHYPDPSCVGLDGPGLRPVMTLKSRVTAVRTLPAGTCVSYGCTATLESERTLAVVPIGYADGFPRLLSNRSAVLLHGARCPIVGRVCMDMCMVDVTGRNVQPGDVAEVFGAALPVEEHAAAADTIQYELLCAVSPRVPRLYLG